VATGDVHFSGALLHLFFHGTDRSLPSPRRTRPFSHGVPAVRALRIAVLDLRSPQSPRFSSDFLRQRLCRRRRGVSLRVVGSRRAPLLSWLRRFSDSCRSFFPKRVLSAAAAPPPPKSTAGWISGSPCGRFGRARRNARFLELPGPFWVLLPTPVEDRRPRFRPSPSTRQKVSANWPLQRG